jgi:hypothetical protein
MRKILIIVGMLFFSVQPAWSEIRSYSLNQMEITDDVGKSKLIPILTIDNKPKTMKLVVAGLGTNRITAQCPIYSLVVETEIYPMGMYTPAHSYSRDDATDKAKWYYVRHDQGVTVIEVKGENVKVYNLGMVTYTYVGTMVK